MNPEYKEKMEEYVEECKNDYKDIDNENTEDLPQGVNEVKDGLHECIDDFEEHGEKCFKSCSKRKINSISNMANALMDPKYMQILKQFNAREYRSSQKKLRPHGKLISKLANPKVRYHEKRKTLQKAQVGEGLMNLAKTLIIPLMERFLNSLK